MIIECVGSSIKVWVNGDLVNYGYDCTASRGNIAVQAEGSEVEFRKLEISPIKSLQNKLSRFFEENFMYRATVLLLGFTCVAHLYG